ncbi:MAG: hypothetical protein ACREQ5_10320 [Candidatus Dormibacteria bacterium]
MIAEGVLNGGAACFLSVTDHDARVEVDHQPRCAHLTSRISRATARADAT